MMSFIWDTWNTLSDLRDPDTLNFPLGGSSYLPFEILTAYIYFVFKLGPQLMKSREPLQLKSLILVYNGLQIPFNIAMGIYVIYSIWFGWDNSFCVSKNEHILNAILIYNFNKYFDLIETIIYVLRKKYNQISFLHVYHHLMVIFVMYLQIVWIPYGLFVVYIAINCVVHTFMYSYYFLSMYNPSNKYVKVLKQYVTRIQLVQFMIMLCIFTMALIVDNCGYPKFFYWLPITQSSIFIFLFARFYIKTYLKKQSKRN